MKEYKSKPIIGEVPPSGFSLQHEQTVHITNNNQSAVFVDGVVFDTMLNLELHFSKQFQNIENATSYFNKVLKKYPNSQISVVEKTEKEIQVWA
ncbi:MAG: hypothetical protein JNL70_00955 [Saprospiraceae bacterium]|nr:hypothetical protein [Saprospiraceae bacterium]